MKSGVRVRQQYTTYTYKFTNDNIVKSNELQSFIFSSVFRIMRLEMREWIMGPFHFFMTRCPPLAVTPRMSAVGGAMHSNAVWRSTTANLVSGLSYNAFQWVDRTRSRHVVVPNVTVLEAGSTGSVRDGAVGRHDGRDLQWENPRW